MKNLFTAFLQILFLLSSLSSFAGEAYERGGVFQNAITEKDLYLSQVQPLLDKRCTVCHSCFEAPCQLKLNSPEFVKRGAHHRSASGSLFSSSPRSDLMLTLAEQRKGGFFSILEGGSNSLLVQVLTAGRSEKPPEKYVDPEKRTCVKSPQAFQSLDSESQKRLGMPYYAAPLANDEFATLVNWASQGAPMPDAVTLKRLAEPRVPQVIHDWERFFNTPSWKGKWTARYIYEHMFTGHFYFDQSPGEFYEIVRSKTAAPLDIVEIATKRPFHMPKELENKFFYRFRKVTTTILQKQHFVYHIKTDTMDELKNWFWNSKWNFSPETRPFNFSQPNPFVAFEPIPAEARYRWMLKNARMLLDMDMRSDNCHGNGATGPLHENFLIFFVKPESDVSVQYSNYFEFANPHLGMANTTASNLILNTRFKANQLNYSKVKSYFQKILRPEGFTFDDIWDGEGETQTAFYTLMRHEKNVSMHNGAWGPIQRVALLFDYTSFERLYYNCVALSTLFDNVNDKIGTVLYLRDVGREAEEQMLSLVPEAYREQVRADWIQGEGMKHRYDDSRFALPFNRALNSLEGFKVDAKDPFKSMIRYMLLNSKRFTEKSVGPYFYLTSNDTPEFAKLKKVSQDLSHEFEAGKGNPAHYFPNVSVIRVASDSGELRYYTVITSRYYEYINYLKILPAGRFNHGRDPKRDYMAIYPGLYVNYPGKVYDVKEVLFEAFIQDMGKIRSRLDYVGFDQSWGVQKLSDKFWPVIDRLQEDFIKTDVINNGLLDLSEYGLTDLTGSP